VDETTDQPKQAGQTEFHVQSGGSDVTAPEAALSIKGYSLPHRILIRPLSLQNTFDQTYERLLMVIKFGFVRSGERLPTERELTQRLGVSRTTVREALQALRTQGYVEARSGRTGGTFVVYEPRPTTREEAARFVRRHPEALSDALDIRAAVEPMVARLAAERAEDKEITNIRAILVAEKKAPKHRRRQIDVHFHLAIAAACRSPSLSDAVLAVQLRLHEMIGYVPMLEVTMRKSERQHDEIADAIADRDPSAADRAMRDHLSVTSNVLSEFANKVVSAVFTRGQAGRAHRGV
jgi:DNA-binding FadR family transcriptional regulator